MGNGSSQSIVLGPPRFQGACPVRNGYQYQGRGVPNYVHPQNRVLPKPVVGQRLRTTDNGSILQTAGTIRGQRQDGNGKEGNLDPEVLGILRKRSEMIEKENDCYRHLNLRNHRLFHSDPDIARRAGPAGFAVDHVPETRGKRRSSGGGVAVRASKLKYKKKSRAPEPPPIDNIPQRQQDVRSQFNLDDVQRRNQKNLPCRCVAKTKAPQPPAITVHPPPPPPLPDGVTTRTKTGASPCTTSRNEVFSRSPTVTRAVECHEMRTNYEKNVHPLEKWRNYRSTGDIRIDEEEDVSLHPSRTTVFDSRKIPDSQTKQPSYLPVRPDPFQKEIQAVTKKIAESRQESFDKPTEDDHSKITKNTSSEGKQQRGSSAPPKFYFSDAGVFKQPNGNGKQNFVAMRDRSNSRSDAVQKSDHDGNDRSNQDCTTADEIVPSLQRFSPGRRRFKSPRSSSTSTPENKTEKEWEKLSKSLYHKHDEESDIDIRLRPVLPRKPPEVPKFSPTEAWQALGSDGLGSSNQSTSDDGHESRPPYKRDVIPQRSTADDRQRRLSDMTFGMYDKRNVDIFKHRSMSDSAWTPRQDLLDDSDASSDGSEEAVVPRIRASSGEISTRFSLPTVMFSNMRPIGTEFKPGGPQPSFEDPKAKQSKKKMAKRVDPVPDHGMAPNFRRFLSKRNKYSSEEDIAVSDSNWTFGQQGLQKRGKQYSSDFLLSDKKKYELMVKNNHFSDFLGDILVSKANHMRNQMKSSDSGNSNFSFYSTEGQILYVPEKGGFIKNNECSPPTKGRVYDMRRRFDANLEPKRPNFVVKKKSNPSDVDLNRKRDLELAKMLEDEVRKRRNKEKITIRQQLQKMKSLRTDDEEEDDFDDEAYFTEPKSREDSNSPFFASGPQRRFLPSDMASKPSRFRQAGATNAIDSSRLSHWQSSPALLEDSVMRNAIRPMNKGCLSSSSVMSSPDPEVWIRADAVVDTWLQRQRRMDSSKFQEATAVQKHSSADACILTVSTADPANDGDVSSSPTPAAPQKKERRKTNIYKQLMDIVRKEERHLEKAQRSDCEPASRESSYSQRESSPSTCSESSSTSSYSYSDSSGSRNHGKNGIPANNEFHTSGYTQPPFQVAFVQPYAPNKGYRPVPFDVGANGYRLQGLQEEGKQIQAEVS